jgi:hypothetical protein
LPLQNLSINRICLHEIYRRDEERAIVPPTFSNALLQLTVEARAVFASRVVAAFKSGAQCMEMDVLQFGPGSVIALGAAFVGANDHIFIDNSRSLAGGLAAAQGSRQIPGGVVAVFDGTVGFPSTPFFAVMKAELHEGFLKQANLQVSFVDSLFLSPKTKLYKIGFFVSDASPVRPALPGGWSSSVYDNQLSASQREGAATYFHSTFLGLAIPDSARHQVKQFFEKTRGFIRPTLPTKRSLICSTGCTRI